MGLAAERHLFRIQKSGTKQGAALPWSGELLAEVFCSNESLPLLPGDLAGRKIPRGNLRVYVSMSSQVMPLLLLRGSHFVERGLVLREKGF